MTSLVDSPVTYRDRLSPYRLLPAIRSFFVACPPLGMLVPKEFPYRRVMMQVSLNEWQESATCCWCEKSRECVTTTFSDGFLKEAAMCWKCLQTAFKVRSRQQADKAQPDKSKPQETR